MHNLTLTWPPEAAAAAPRPRQLRRDSDDVLSAGLEAGFARDVATHRARSTGLRNKGSASRDGSGMSLVEWGAREEEKCRRRRTRSAATDRLGPGARGVGTPSA